MVAHSLAHNAKNISDDVIWLEDSPPPALDALYHDSLSIIKWNLVPVSKKKKKKKKKKEEEEEEEEVVEMVLRISKH